ncbi:hypothetical protein EFT58_07335 [Lactococcus lactis]|uniref:hypothetical protein n=1 Tax=Lactococcus lactis TaxID=1358 RepID=UPI001455DCA7|nr:hypothetical protein [Lactococcus lactis]MCT2920405.1 hypothetical protein [Lactococcus lactis]NLS46823.1 hypothetical protein [Lactococcus lactis]
MYKGFNLEIGSRDHTSFLDISQDDIVAYEKKIEKLRENLSNNIERVELPRNEDKSIDATQLINDWFPKYKPEVFISHSHNDEQTAKRIACWLEKNFNLETFIDSTVWGNANDLLQKIDDTYCVMKRDNKGVKTYNYSKRNFTTSHVHMMLSTALNDMIYTSECILFLNTPQSVQTAEINKHKRTSSPWIYSELKTASIVEKKCPRKDGIIIHRDNVVKNYVREDISYRIGEQLAIFDSLNSEDLKEWYKLFNHNKGTNIHPLDCLYLLKRQ